VGRQLTGLKVTCCWQLVGGGEAFESRPHLKDGEGKGRGVSVCRGEFQSCAEVVESL